MDTRSGVASRRHQPQDPITAAARISAESAAPEPPPAVRAPEPEPEPESDAALDDQLLLAGELTRLGPAFEVLFGIWGLDFDEPVTNGCDMAESAGYACLIQRGSWTSLRQLDRPAILALTDSRGKKHQVVLESVQGAVSVLPPNMFSI